MTRAADIQAFLVRFGYGDARVVPLAQDASFRRYLRLTGGARPAVLMDAPPPEDVRPFLRIAAHLAGLGLSVPDIVGADAERGLVLEEDLGDALFSVLIDAAGDGRARAREGAQAGERGQAGDGTKAEEATKVGGATTVGGASRKTPPPLVGGGWGEGSCGSVPGNARTTPPPNPLPQGEGESLSLPPPPPSPSPSPSDHPAIATLIDAAVDVLATIQRAAPPPDLPAWGAPEMAQTALGTLLDWWWPAAFGAPAPRQARDDFAAALAATLRPVAEGPRGFTHRDYFAGNLLWLPHRAGLCRVGLLDFQSAALGHPAYDLVSLVQDARRDIPPATADRAVSRYLAARPELDSAAFRDAFAACALQRHLRVACQWVRLAQRDGRRQYLAYGPRTWRLLADALRHPAAAPLAQAMDRWIPPDLRANPKGLAA